MVTVVSMDEVCVVKARPEVRPSQSRWLPGPRAYPSFADGCLAIVLPPGNVVALLLESFTGRGYCCLDIPGGGLQGMGLHLLEISGDDMARFFKPPHTGVRAAIAAGRSDGAIPYGRCEPSSLGPSGASSEG